MELKNWRNWQVPLGVIFGIFGYQVWAFCNTFYSSSGKLDDFPSVVYWGAFASLLFYPAAYLAVFELMKRVKARAVEKTKAMESGMEAVVSIPAATENLESKVPCQTL